MPTEKFEKLLSNKKILISDGATGTNLMRMGLPNGQAAEYWVLENPDAILQLHENFIASGSEILLTCTFGASKTRLEMKDLDKEFSKINQIAVALAQQASKGTDILIAGSIGPLGQMLKPIGLLDESDAERVYADQAHVLSDSGVDLILIETQFDLTEAHAAVRGAKSVCDLPIICSFSFDRGTKTMMGVSPSAFAQSFISAGLYALGINCGKSLEDNLAALQMLYEVTSLPIWFKPNAGLPKISSSGQTEYDVTPDLMAKHVPSWIANGARFIGGCCGTSPAHLKEISTAVHATIE